jgi:hypothetical protein
LRRRERIGDAAGLDMPDGRDTFEVSDDELISAEERYALWEWARAAGVSAEELRKALQPARQNL